MKNKRSFWIGLCLINLCIVAALGFTLRSKILFSLPLIDYRSVLSAHSHFAFAGWAGLALITFLIYDLLPPALAGRRFYQWILWAIEISSLGMAIGFPIWAYNAITIFFSTLYVAATVVFAPFFIKDLLRSGLEKTVKLLAVSAVTCLIISFLGTLGLTYILWSKSGNSLLYRDSIYTFLHFQYNGFFTLGVFALLLNYLIGKGIVVDKKARLFSVFLCLSVIPAMALSILWHNQAYLYVIAAIGCILILTSLFFYSAMVQDHHRLQPFSITAARNLWILSSLSFGLKMLLNVGTIFPPLGNAVYGDRPVIIGFLHLIFLGFLTFFILSKLIEERYFHKGKQLIVYPFYVFAGGVIANEVLLMLQGLGILFKTNSFIYSWLLWGAAIVLVTGAALIAIERYKVARYNRVH
jgi:hypothetical protein